MFFFSCIFFHRDTFAENIVSSGLVIHDIHDPICQLNSIAIKGNDEDVFMLWALYDRGRQWRFCYCFMLVEFYKGCWFGWFFFVVTKLVNLCSAKVHFSP